MNDDITTLKEFIDENINLITATGVFGALTVYFSSSDIYKEDILLLFLLSIIFVVLCFELGYNSPGWNHSSGKLKIFLASFLLITLNIYAKITFQMGEIVNLYLEWILAFIYLFGIFYLIRKLNLEKKLEHLINISLEKNVVVGFIVILLNGLIIVGLVFLLVSLTEEYVRNFLTKPII